MLIFSDLTENTKDNAECVDYVVVMANATCLRAAHKVRRGLTKAIMTSSNVELYNGFPSGPEGSILHIIPPGFSVSSYSIVLFSSYS
ncbi:hypothetical protein TNCV_4524431 [Trichonephila clavipes]|nr:hypothetical protein TNCV_4524431 [Trichonephila clavipes]